MCIKTAPLLGRFFVGNEFATGAIPVDVIKKGSPPKGLKRESIETIRRASFGGRQMGMCIAPTKMLM